MGHPMSRHFLSAFSIVREAPSSTKRHLSKSSLAVSPGGRTLNLVIKQRSSPTTKPNQQAQQVHPTAKVSQPPKKHQNHLILCSIYLPPSANCSSSTTISYYTSKKKHVLCLSSIRLKKKTSRLDLVFRSSSTAPAQLSSSSWLHKVPGTPMIFLR